MSTEHNHNPAHDGDWINQGHPVDFWLETWWPLLVIVFGISLFSIFCFWKPFTV